MRVANNARVPDTRLTFFGAVGEVTGSCTLVDTGAARVLVDFGMIQGAQEFEPRNLLAPNVEFGRVDAVVVTHAHIDHCGRLPMLPRLGFGGKVWMTPPTHELLGPVLHSSARVQAIRLSEAMAASNRRIGRGAGSRAGGCDRGAPSPKVWASTPRQHGEELGATIGETDAAPFRLYDSLEVDAVLRRVETVDYLQRREIAPGVHLRMLDAGHVIGSASVELECHTPRGVRRIVFSGDLGPSNAPLLAPPEPIQGADAVVMESTYGDREHPTTRDTMMELARVVQQSREDRCRVIIPTFTLGRAQQLLYRLGQLSRDGILAGLPVYLDSKMALVAGEIYSRHPELLDARSRERVRGGDWPLQFKELVYIETRDDSRRLNSLRGAGIIVAGSGFCHGGPVVHHLISAFRKPESIVVLVGHQPAGTPAGDMARGYPSILLDEREYEVGCRIKTISGLSGHADRNDLMRWLGKDASSASTIGRVILNHGEPDSRERLAARLKTDLNIQTERPQPEQSISI